MPVNLLQYADDTCLVANSPASYQHLLDMTALWLQWSGMKVKISKCAALDLKALSGKKTDPLISLQSDHIPFASHGVQFLGLHVDTPQDSSRLRAELLNNVLDRVDSCPLTSKQKLLVYRSGVCPCISWDLIVVEFPISWVQRNLDSQASEELVRPHQVSQPCSTLLIREEWRSQPTSPIHHAQETPIFTSVTSADIS